MELTTDKYDLWECVDCYRVVVRDWYKAARLNWVLKYYPEGTRFQINEEPVFKIPKANLQQAMEILQN